MDVKSFSWRRKFQFQNYSACKNFYKRAGECNIWKRLHQTFSFTTKFVNPRVGSIILSLSQFYRSTRFSHLSTAITVPENVLFESSRLLCNWRIFSSSGLKRFQVKKIVFFLCRLCGIFASSFLSSQFKVVANLWIFGSIIVEEIWEGIMYYVLSGWH